jgi:hypothetical protein
MGKVIEFKKFSKNINKDNLNKACSDLNMFPDNDSSYIRKEIDISLVEVDHIINCIYKQLLINEQLITNSENTGDFDKLLYLKDFNDKLHDVMYFVTNSVYKNPIIIKVTFLEFKYLVGTLQLEIGLLNDPDENEKSNVSSDYLKVIENLYNRFYHVYKNWENEFYSEPT